MSNITTAISRDHKPRYKCLHSKKSRLTDQTCQSSRKMYRRPFSSGSSSNTGSSTDTTTSGGSLKKTMFQTYEGQKFVTYSLKVENTAGWVLRNQLSDVMYTGGLWADTRTVHEVKNYENQLGGESVR